VRTVRSYRWLVSALAATAVALSACGSGSSGNDDEKAATAATTGAAAETTGAAGAETTSVTVPEPAPPSEATVVQATTVSPTTTSASPTGPETAPDSTPETSTEASTTDADALANAALDTEGRPYDVFVPSTYDAATPAPLLVLLHGYTSSGAKQEQYFKLEPIAEERGMLYVHPDGLVDARGQQFWNATDACCDLFGRGIDDVTYLRSLLTEVRAKYNVDPARIFFVAGATFADPSACTPSEPVTVVQIHGTADEVIAYAGGAIIGKSYPSAQTTGKTWAAYNGCSATPKDRPGRLDLEATIDGAESTVSAYSGCPDDGIVEVWTIDGGLHIPEITDSVFRTALDLLLAHPKTAP
jgi:polyhydroxybutyrate depolymerase